LTARFLPSRVHGVIDYAWGVALIATPYLFGFATGGAAQWTAMAFGIGAILYSAATDYEVGLVRLLPMPLHLALDFAAGAALAATPWVLGFAGAVFWPHLLFGLFSMVASLVTITHPSRPVLEPFRSSEE
jgi:hypothetical protein